MICTIKLIAVNVSFKDDGFMYFNNDKIIKVDKPNDVHDDILFTGYNSGFSDRRTNESERNEKRILKIIHEKLFENCLKILQGKYGMFMVNDDNEDDIEDEEFQANDNIEVIQE